MSARFGRRAFLAASACAGSGLALGRTPYGGVLRLVLPFRGSLLDPHELDDPLAALFAPAIADSLYAFDAAGEPYPTLAAALPERTARGTRVLLRSELVSARGKPLGGADIVYSLTRARARGGSAVLGALAPPAVASDDPLAVLFGDAPPAQLSRALASPLTAIVPRGFSPLRPDGTGAFLATPQARGLSLQRNTRAARGAAFLDRIEVGYAADLRECLRAFEVGDSDLGWLGNGLYRPREGSVGFEGPSYGWVVLLSGLDAGAWGAPGVAQALRDAIPNERLSHFGLVALPGAPQGAGWGGGSAGLAVRDDAPELVEIARALSGELSRPGHELRLLPLPRARVTELRRSRRFELLLDFVRRPSDDPSFAAQALRAAIDPELARHPPPRPILDLREVTRGLPLGVVGALELRGARTPDLSGLAQWQLGAVFRRPT